MARLKAFAHVCKVAQALLPVRTGKSAGATLLAILALALCATPARAQYIGNVGLASTVSNFTYAGGLVTVVIPPCDATHTSNCIEMIGQAAHLLNLNYAIGNECEILLDGSADGSHWSTLAAAHFNQSNAAQSQLTTANGYFPLMRVKINPGGTTCAAITGTYSGFQVPLPLSNLALNFSNSAVGAVHNVGGTTIDTPYLFVGCQCFNPNNAVAWLQLFDAHASPILGTTPPTYQAAIPALGAFTLQPGVSLLGTLLLWAGATTTAGGATPVASALTCNFQINYNGPFVPLTPPSP